jgi:uncharacterized protein YlaN (UPF0358 family)
MHKNYYFVLAAVPPLTMGELPEISFKEFQQLLSENLSEGDFEQFEKLLWPIQLYNLRALWLGEELDERGEGSVPDFVLEYMERYETDAERLRYFSSLYVSLYQQKLDGFLKWYFQLEREIRLVLLALRAKRTGKDVVRELQFEDPTDLLVADILAQKDASEYTPPKEYEELKTIFSDHSGEPEKLHRALLRYRFQKIEEMEENQDFGIDRVLNYAARLMLVEMDRENGKA